MDSEINKEEVNIEVKQLMSNNDVDQSATVEEKTVSGVCSDSTKVYKRRLCVLVLIVLVITVGAITGIVMGTKKNNSPSLSSNSAINGKSEGGVTTIDSTSAPVSAPVETSIPVTSRVPAPVPAPVIAPVIAPVHVPSTSAPMVTRAPVVTVPSMVPFAAKTTAPTGTGM